MIKANELRIGSWVTEHGSYLQISLNDDDLWHTDNFEGIPLTPEILEKCGFYDDGWLGDDCNWSRFLPINELKAIRITNPFEFSILCVLDPKEADGEDLYISAWVEIGNIQHLHQLQNLYFAFTGTELEINL